MILRLTTIGRQTLADGANRRTRAVTLTRLAAGSGSGPGGAANDARTTLRNERASAAATGATALAGRLVARADLMPAVAFNVTEVGLFAQVGSAAEILLAYWTKGGDVLAAASPGVTIVLAAVIEIQAAAAEIAVTLNPAVTITGASTFLGLTDTPAAYVGGQPLLRANAAGDAVELVAPTALRLDATQLVSGLVPEARLGYQRYAVATADAVNTMAETTVLSFQVGANEMAEQDYLRIQWIGEWAAPASASGTRTIKFSWGDAAVTLASKGLSGTATLRFTLDAWRQGATLWLAPNSNRGHDDPIGDAVHSLTPPFAAAHTVALTVQHTRASPDVSYRVRVAIVQRWPAP